MNFLKAVGQSITGAMLEKPKYEVTDKGEVNYYLTSHKNEHFRTYFSSEMSKHIHLMTFMLLSIEIISISVY